MYLNQHVLNRVSLPSDDGRQHLQYVKILFNKLTSKLKVKVYHERKLLPIGTFVCESSFVWNLKFYIGPNKIHDQLSDVLMPHTIFFSQNDSTFHTQTNRLVP